MSIIKRNGTHTGNIPTFFNDFFNQGYLELGP